MAALGRLVGAQSARFRTIVQATLLPSPMMRAMELTLPTEKLYRLEEQLSFDDIKQRAADRRTQAFSSGFGGLLQRPKNDEVVLVASQRRLEPFWHVAGHARYVYDRSRNYSVPTSGPEVQSVTVNGSDYSVVAQTQARAFSVPVLEHCVEEARSEHFVDGRTGTPVADGPQVVAGPRSEIAHAADLAAPRDDGPAARAARLLCDPDRHRRAVEAGPGRPTDGGNAAARERRPLLPAGLRVRIPLDSRATRRPWSRSMARPARCARCPRSYTR